MSKPVTMDDIARHVGVTKMTVSCTLRDTGRVALATRERIRQACRELGYQPNAAARAVARGRFGAVALLLSTHGGRSTMPGPLLTSIHDALAERELHVMLTRLPDETLTSEGFVPQILREYLADGLLINYHHAVPDAMVRLIEDHHLPSIWLNAKRDHDAVYPDDFAAGRDITAHLIELGHRRIAYHDLGRNAALREQGSRHYSQEDRCAGYREAMSEAGLTPRLIEDVESVTPKNVVQYTADQLTAADRPTALVAGEHGIVRHAATLAGLAIPRDLSLAAFLVDPCVGDEMRPTAMIVPNAEMGTRAVGMLTRRIDNGEEKLRSHCIPLWFKDGCSTAPPRGDTS
ncbi:MAG: LacI family DNA-binding transcriptional regulator [Phycisphaerae bacterium]|nr:LacI family DNA-binding transcriptional regulator [Phycisphaerae bacterium]